MIKSLHFTDCGYMRLNAIQNIGFNYVNRGFWGQGTHFWSQFVHNLPPSGCNGVFWYSYVSPCTPKDVSQPTPICCFLALTVSATEPPWGPLKDRQMVPMNPPPVLPTSGAVLSVDLVFKEDTKEECIVDQFQRMKKNKCLFSIIKMFHYSRWFTYY